MRNKIVMGNWKMHGDLQTVSDLIQGITSNLPENLTCQCAVIPPSIFIPQAAELLKNSQIQLGAQNIYPADKGAYTGEISAPMLKEYNCNYVLVGHSERRHILGESDKFVAQKFQHAKANGLTPVLCIGETLEEREDGLTEEVIARQLLAITADSATSAFNGCIIAYEPVWAIGTGKTATPEQAQEVHSFIRGFINSKSTPILYGGSVNDSNAQTLFSAQDVDGGLVGGAALDAVKFSKIIAAANS